jgi:hypothetical protein
MRYILVLSYVALALMINLVAGAEKMDTPGGADKAVVRETVTAARPAVATVADKVFINGKIITMNDQQPEAQAVAVKDGVITYVGDLRGARSLMGENTQRVDLNGRTMVPGFCRCTWACRQCGPAGSQC